MKNYWFVLMFVLATSACSTKKAPVDCIYPVGDLLFDTDKMDWENVYLGKEYVDTVKVYNPTSKAIRLEGYNHSTEIQVRKAGEDPSDWQMGGFDIAPGACDTLILSLNVVNESFLGSYFYVVRFMVNGDVDYKYGITVETNVVENFDKWSVENKSQAPHIVIDTLEYNFGTIKQGEDVSTVFHVKNAGGRDLIIRKLEATCGCTAIIPGQRVISPEKTINLDVIFHSAGKSGKQRKTITLFCNDPLQPMVKLVLSGEIVL